MLLTGHSVVYNNPIVLVVRDYWKSNANVAGLPKTGCIKTMGDFIIVIFITFSNGYDTGN